MRIQEIAHEKPQCEKALKTYLLSLSFFCQDGYLIVVTLAYVTCNDKINLIMSTWINFKSKQMQTEPQCPKAASTSKECRVGNRKKTLYGKKRSHLGIELLSLKTSGHVVAGMLHAAFAAIDVVCASSCSFLAAILTKILICFICSKVAGQELFLHKP